jgi:hypothetical protein
MTVGAVGQPGFPPNGTPDPDLLLFAESMHSAFLSRDKSTMIGHIINHMAAGHHTWGVFLLKGGHPTAAYADNLILIWSLSEAEDWRDRVEYLPW